MIDSYNYDANYNPSMPVVTVRLRSLYPNSQEVQISTLVDSGSDGTMLPMSVLRQINARQVGEGVIRGVAGGRRVVGLYEVLVQIGPFALGKFEVAGNIAETEAILGRDILNLLVITLNGLGLTVEISD